VTGVPEACEAAVAALEALVPVVETYAIESKYHRFIIGTKGTGIRAIQDAANVRLNVPNEPVDEITIRGLPTNIEAAKKLLEAKMPEYEDSLKKNFNLVVEVPNRYHRRIIGHRGADINKIRTQFDIIIDMGKPAADNITLVGYQEKCEECAALLQSMVEEFDKEVEAEIDVHHSIHKFIIGPRGSTLREIEKKHNCRITMPRRDSTAKDTIVIAGIKDNVEECVQHIFSIQDEHEDDILDYDEFARPTQPAAPKPSPKKKRNGNQQVSWDASSVFPTLGGSNSSSTPSGVWAARK
jgi:rRNA processing protein Krr1/Pno1